MNATYPPQHSPPLHYRDGPPPAPPAQYLQHPISASQLSHPQQPEQMGQSYPADYGLTPLAPGAPPTAVEPMPRSCIENGRKYELQVIQQPRRARMCGFGDKDRRPITPPPCVRLIITDTQSWKEIDINNIDHNMFVLNVDLWSVDGTKQVNLVRHSPTSPSISATTPVSYQHSHEGTPAYSNILPGQYAQRDVKYESGPQSGAYNSYTTGPAAAPYGQTTQTYPPTSQYYDPGYAPTTNGSQPYNQNGYTQPQSSFNNRAIGQNDTQQAGGDYSQQISPSTQLTSYSGRPYQQQNEPPSTTRLPLQNTQPTGMYTRNLIGSLSASAFRLSDPSDRIGIWFVLQDLSVRTEGQFRLRFSFVNVGIPTTPPANSDHPGKIREQLPPVVSQVNKGKAPILAACFSEVFTVYSAKRFPGVVESTGLSKCFATQGIKIPIRKDGVAKSGKNDDYDED